MDHKEFDDDKHINLSQLHKECQKQTNNYFKWAKRAVEKKNHADRLEMVKEVVEAQLQAKARKYPKKFGVQEGARGGITEAAVKAAVYSHPEYVDACDQFLDAKEEAAIIGKAEITMDQKKRMLELLVTLHGLGYFASPRIAKPLLDAHKDKLDRQQGGHRSFQKHRARKVKD